MQIIWYNPDLDCYEKGDKNRYEALITASVYPERFSVLYQFNRITEKLADKVLNSLNFARQADHLMQ